ncbi:Z1 domain-containing protein [Streptacidiphilus sp. MAP5-3]|uniref:Z1 domain-containing protein n=1 Tax=Streptacidiphilus sp. MAP5-3 TaxID=3156265 RepID=UPI0035179C86
MGDSPDEPLSRAIRLVRGFLEHGRQPTQDEVEDAVNMVFGMLAGRGEQLDRAELLKEVETLVTVFQERSLGLSDPKGHEAWLQEAKVDRSWDFWERYRWFLEDVKKLPLSVVHRLDQTTDDVLGQLEDPRRQGPWRRRGLVIGQVQSGKTGQYIGLGAKAVDAGYQFIVVLAGIHNDLRSQTQLRIDEGLLGFNTQYQMRANEPGRMRAMGAGRMPLQGRKRLDIASPTNSREDGDFGRKAAATINFPLGRFPVVLVVKKHWRILEYLRNWAVDVQGTELADGGRIVQDIPLLVIDDEADNASINTVKDPDADPTKTNQAIRELLNSFEKSAYVGYTATPFANIYIDPDAEHEKAGEDLFPESFIRSLSPPSNYLGPERVFGLRVADDDEPDIAPLPLVRHVRDAESWLPLKHKASANAKGEPPASLREAVMAFVLACAARRARGQARVHNSMLVHVTRFTRVQGQVHEQVDDLLRHLRDVLRDRYGRGAELLAEFRQLWETDFEPTTDCFAADEALPLTWEKVEAELSDALKKIIVKSINGTSQDVLDYHEHRRIGLSVIAIGGQKLSRGLTLEGLTVSYYLRWANTYDSLLQMGRWFGYRPGFEDLCRLYTTTEVQAAYVEVTSAADELRREVEEMSTLGLTPREFGLKVRASSLGLMVTAANKMSNGKRVLLSYSGEGPETVIFDLGTQAVRHNLQSLEQLVRQLDALRAPEVDGRSGTVTWAGISPDHVAAFLAGYRADRMAQRVRPRLIADYIEQCARNGELGSWTVALVSSSQATSTLFVGGHEVGPVRRGALNDDFRSEGRYTIRRVLSPVDEQLGLDDRQVRAALEETKAEARLKERPKEPKEPSGVYLRRQRDPGQALLLLYPIIVAAEAGSETSTPTYLVGFQVSFPESERHVRTEYMANGIYLQEDIYPLDAGEDGE